MLGKIVLAAAAGVVAFLICVFVGGLLATLGVPPAEFIGKFLQNYAYVIAVLVAILYFFRGGLPGVP